MTVQAVSSLCSDLHAPAPERPDAWCACCGEAWEGDTLDCPFCGELARVTSIGEQADAEVAMRDRDAGVRRFRPTEGAA